nr:hypothetical protein [Tanacetum cinerariifolium]
MLKRDTLSHPPCALVQPSTQNATEEPLKISDFGKDLCPPIYPLGYQQWKLSDRVPLISLHCLQFIPTSTLPLFSIAQCVVVLCLATEDYNCSSTGKEDCLEWQNRLRKLQNIMLGGSSHPPST